MSTPIYKLPIAADGKGFAPLEIDARLLEGTSPGSGSPAPIAWVAGQSEPPGLLTLETPGFAEGNTNAQVRIVMSAQATTIPEEPVAFRLRMAPSQANDETRFEGGEVIADLAVKISDLLIEWDAEPANYKRGSALVMPLLKDKDVQLKLKARRITASGVTEDDEAISFTQAIKPPGFSTQVFGEVSERADARRALTTWRCNVDMAAVAAQGLSLPVECSIEIEARAGTDSPPKDSLSIPVTLTEPKAKLELIEPELPIPADGLSNSMVLQVFWQLDEQSPAMPASELELQIEKKTPGDGIDAKLQLTGGAKTDKEGQLCFDYTPPELYYQPGGKYEDVYVVYLGSGAARKSLGEIRIPLSPSIRFTLSAVKQALLDEEPFGIEFPEEEIWIEADEQARSVKGVLKLIEAVPGGAKREIPVNKAEIALAWYDGTQFVPAPKTDTPTLTDAKGVFTLATPEITSIMPAGKGVDYLIPDADAPIGALLDAPAHEMDEYQRVLGQMDDLTSRLPESTATKIRAYRQVFVLHLAQLETKDFKEIQSSARLFTKIVGYAGLFYKNYRTRWDRLWNYVKDAVLGVIDLIWECIQGSETIVDFLAPAGKWIMDKGGWVLDVAFRNGGRLLVSTARALRPLIERARSMAGSLFEGTMHFLEIAERNFDELLDGLEASFVNVSAFIGCIARSMLSIACIIGSVFMALFSVLASIITPLLERSGAAGIVAGEAEVLTEFARKFIAGVCKEGGKYGKPWGETMEAALENWGKQLRDYLWDEQIRPAMQKSPSSTGWLDFADPGRLTYAIPLEYAHDYAKESPPTVPTDWEDRVQGLSELRRDQYYADLAVDNAIASVDLLRDILSLILDVGKIIVMVVTVIVSAPTVVGAVPAIVTVSNTCDAITIAFKTLSCRLVDFPRVVYGLCGVLVEVGLTPFALYVAVKPSPTP